mgnify:CR=1 FL=1
MSNLKNLPAPSPEQGLNRYMQEIRKFPMLEPEEEYMLAKRWVDHEDTEAAHKMVTSHLRLAAKIAMGYRGYGLPQSEVISEANVGLMQAVKKFDPEKGFRLATYAMWWIRAAIQEYILRSWENQFLNCIFQCPFFCINYKSFNIMIIYMCNICN